MKVWVVIRSGVYMQGIFGIYTTEELAKEALLTAKRLEPDDYHTLKIESADLDTPVGIGYYYYDGLDDFFESQKIILSQPDRS